MGTLDKVSVLQMSKGAILERVDYEMGRVIDNILDVNTKPTAKRKITLTLDIRPDEDRQTVSIDTTAKSTLAPTKAVTTTLYISEDNEGAPLVAEMVPQVPGQQSLEGEEQDQPKILNFIRKEA